MMAATGQNTRARKLQALEATWLGIQYDGRRYLWDGRTVEEAGLPDLLGMGGPETANPIQGTTEGCRPPRHQRIPCRRSGLGGLIVRRFTELLFGAGRRPHVTVAGDPDTTDYLGAAFAQAGGWAQLLEARDYGGAEGTAVLLGRVKEGGFRLDLMNARHCTPTWADRSDLVLESVEEVYPYEAEEKGEDGRVRPVVLWYRRIVDQRTDSIWRAVKAARKGSAPEPEEWGAPDEVYEHGLDRCPVVWIQNEAVEAEVDGRSDLEGLPSQIERLDYLLSEGDSGTLASLDPTLLLMGVRRDELEGPVQTGHKIALVLEGENVSARYLELSGTSVDAGTKQADAAKGSILEQAQCVLVAPADLPGMGQGKDALEAVYRPMLARCDRLREQWGQAIERLSDLFVALGQVADVKLPDRVEVVQGGKETRTARKLGRGGSFSVTWGRYFEPTAEDATKELTIAEAALRTGLLQKRTVLRRLAPLFGVDDVEAELEAVSAEAKARAAEEEERRAKLAKRLMPGLEGPADLQGAADDLEDDDEDLEG